METISFAGDGLAPELVPVEELADCAATALKEDGGRILSYGTGAGYTPLRELIAEEFEVHPFRVLITNGWLQGFKFLTQGRLRAQNAIIEYPTYLPALQTVFQGDANVQYLDIREEGPDIEQLAYLLKTSQRPAIAYLMPSFQNPTGQSLTEQERIDVGGALHKARVMIVEDDTYGRLRFTGEEVPTIFELSAKTAVYSASLSTAVAPGLRVGVFILPDELVAPLTALANSVYITPVLLGQATLYEFARRGSYQPHLEELRSSLLERRDAMLAALDEHFQGARWTRPEGGFFILVQLPPGTNAREVIEKAEGVDALAGADFMGLPNSIRLNFAAPALEQIEPGIARLGAAWEPRIEWSRF